MKGRPAKAPKPWVLGLNTASETLGLAIATEDGVRAELYLVPEPGDRGHHAERLMSAVDALCRLSGRDPSTLAGIAIAVGPGGFTGVRTSLSAAKTIAQSLDKPLVGVTTLEALAEQAPGLGLVAPMVDARRGDVFGGLYRKHPDHLEPLLEPALASAPEWAERVTSVAGPEPVAFIGDGAAANPEAVLGRWPCGHFEPAMHLLRAAAVATLGAKRVAEGRVDDPMTLLPEYLRAPSAVPNWQPMCPPGETP